MTKEQEERLKSLSQKQGEAYKETLDFFMELHTSVQQETDDYIITGAFEEAEGMYTPDVEGELVWLTPDLNQNQHIEVMVQDKENLKFVPYLEIYCKLVDGQDGLVGEKKQRFIWHPFLYHYGENWQIPKEGQYHLEVTIREPLFRRHKKKEGNRYTKDVTVKLPPVELVPGKKTA